MTHMLIRQFAKKLAGVFYENADAQLRFWDENQRSIMFRDAFPTVRDYVRGFVRLPEAVKRVPPNDPKYFRVEGSDRWWMIYTPGWKFHVEMARKELATGLASGVYSAHEKQVISEALIADYEAAVSPFAESLLQRRAAGQHLQVN